ncbi:MAG TPA: hypothetical protein VKD90_06435, partial [Gemmataceae bacterium]|nr:hypothetical protein [Gemmataceae bacterium]
AYLHLRAVPFLAFVAAPVAAVNLAAAGGRLAQRPLPEGAVRTLHTVRTAGRGIVGLVGLLLIALTYAGWTHPFAQQRRWKWDVEPSQSMIRAAERIQKWRTEGTLPPEARLLNLQPDFANYVAWFAPAEKTFFDYRFAFHRPEAAEYVALRRYLAPRPPQERRQDPYDLTGFLRKYNVTYAVSAHLRRDYSMAAVEALWADDPQAGGPEWVLWHVDGRAVVLGWTKQEAIPPSDFDRLRFDPLRAAYVEATPLSKPEVRPPLPPQDIWERYVQGPPAPAPEGEEAHVLMRYRESLVLRTARGHRLLLEGTYYLVRGQLMMPGLTVWAGEMGRRVLPVMPASANAVALLAVRAGRKAVTTSPDHADGYYFLAKAYQESGYYLFPEIQETVTAVNFARCKARLPDDAATWRTSVDVLDLLQQLDRAHTTATPRRLDLQLDITRQSVEYLNHLIDQREAELARVTGDERDRVDKEVDQLRKMVDSQARRYKDGKAELEKGTAKYINAAVGQLFISPLNRAALARQFGLVQEATKELRRAHDQFQKDLGEGKKFSSDDLALQLAIHAELIELLMFDGHVEEAAQILESLDTPDTVALMDSPTVRQAYFSHRRQALAILFGGPQRAPLSRYDTDPASHFRSLRQAVALCVGDFQTAIDAQAADLRTVQRDYANHRDLYFRDTPRPPGPLPDQFDLVLDQFYRPLLAPLNPVAAHLGGMARLRYTALADQFLQLSQARVENHVRMALTHLEEGDVPSAARHFAEALKSPEFKDPLPVQRQAEEYLRAIERATGGRGTEP